MSFQIVVKSCWRDKERGYHQAIRDTWGRGFAPGTIRFVMGDNQAGRTSAVDWDEYPMLGVEDDYDHLPDKTRMIARMFALVGTTEYIFLCDCDTFLIPERMKRINLTADYIGRFGPGPCDIGQTFNFTDARRVNHPVCHPWASGGVGYFLSRKAAGLIADDTPMSWAEDLWVGQVMGAALSRGEVTIEQPDQFECWAAWHWRRSKDFNKPSYDPEWMKMMQQKYQRGQI